MKFIFKENCSFSRSLLKFLTLVQHLVNCYSLVFLTGADLLLRVHFYFVFKHIEYIICYAICRTIIISKFKKLFTIYVVVVVVDPTPPTCCQQSPAPESCGSQQSLPPGGKERLHFVGIRPEIQARKGGW